MGAELSDELHAHRLLRLYERRVEEVDERIAAPSVKRVLPELHDRRPSAGRDRDAAFGHRARHLILSGRSVVERLTLTDRGRRAQRGLMISAITAIRHGSAAE
jgi:hypothetical protein